MKLSAIFRRPYAPEWMTIGLFIALSACSRNASQNPHPSDYLGTWSGALSSTVGRQASTIELSLSADGTGRFLWQIGATAADVAEGKWLKADAFLIIDRKDTQGFAAFRVTAKTADSLVIANRDGATVQLALRK